MLTGDEELTWVEGRMSIKHLTRDVEKCSGETRAGHPLSPPRLQDEKRGRIARPALLIVDHENQLTGVITEKSAPGHRPAGVDT